MFSCLDADTEADQGMPMNTEPAETIAELDDWTQALKQIASQPLACCPEFPEIAKRFEAWWAHDMVDRPILIGQANTEPTRPITRRLELLADPQAWLEAKLQDLHNTQFVGDAVPAVRIDLGAVALGGMLGAQVEYGADTTWTHAYIDDDWSNAPDWSIPSENPIWDQLQTLIEIVVEDAAGKYLFCTPDIWGSADVVMNLRGPDNICIDLLEKPKFIRDQIEAIYPAWLKAFKSLYAPAMAHGVGVMHWVGLWSDRPYVVPACDLGFMIGPEQYEEVCLPDIAQQVATVGRGVFHLDGPGSTRHIDALLEVPGLEAIQFTPGEGSPSVMPWLDMFRKIQDKGRSILAFTPPGEVLALCDAVDPKGLAILVDGPAGPTELDDLYAAVCSRYGCPLP